MGIDREGRGHPLKSSSCNVLFYSYFLFSDLELFKPVFTNVEVILTGGNFRKWRLSVFSGTGYCCACKLQASLFTGFKVLTDLTGQGEQRQI